MKTPVAFMMGLFGSFSFFSTLFVVGNWDDLYPTFNLLTLEDFFMFTAACGCMGALFTIISDLY